MPHKIVEVEGVAGKTVQKITVTNESDYRLITVRFSDQTAIHFTLYPRIDIEPELLDWTNGDGEIVRQYEMIGEHDEMND